MIVTVSSGMAGYYAVVLSTEFDYEVIYTGIGRYATKDEAIREAEEISIMEGIKLEV